MAPDPVDELYGLDLEQFVSARDALAKQLRAAGDKDAAAEVKKLPKPTRAAWAVNRLAREKPDEIRALVDAGEALAGAQTQLLEGADAAVLREAADAARRLVDALAEAAPADGPTKEKVRATLHAATVDPEVRAEVAAGRVLKERAAAGFGGLEALEASLPAAPAQAKGRRPAGATKERAGAAKAAAPKTKRDEAAATRARAARAKAAARLRDDLRRAKEAEATAEDTVAGARRALEQVEATITARRRDLEQAERALSDARARRERAEQAAREASASA
jgi:hypothetical protein